MSMLLEPIQPDTTFGDMVDIGNAKESIVEMLRSEPTMMSAVLDSFAEDIMSGHLVEGLVRDMYTQEYRQALLRLMKLGDKMHQEFAQHFFKEDQ